MAWGLADLVAAAENWGPGKSVNKDLFMEQRGKTRAFGLTFSARLFASSAASYQLSSTLIRVTLDDNAIVVRHPDRNNPALIKIVMWRRRLAVSEG
jgi:hypothetical protein